MLNNERIVVLNVDDYEAGRYATTRVLQQAGFEVVEAATGEEALRVTASNHPDLVVLDVNLPDVDGFEVCRRIKSQPETADTPVLYLSAAYRAPEHRVQGLELGADAYLTQPIDPRELVATVNALLRARHVRDAVREKEERYRALMQATSDIIWTTSPQGEFDREQPDWEAFTGQRLAQYRGHGWLDAIHPDDRDSARSAWERALRDHTVFETEYRLRRHDGVYRWFLVRAVPVHEPDGSIREWVGAETDFTDRRRAEEELRERTERLQFLSDAANRLLQASDPREYVEHLFQRLTAYLHLEVSLNHLVRPHDGMLELNAHCGITAASADALRVIPVDHPLVGGVAATGEPVVLDDLRTATGPLAEVGRALGLGACACYPLLGDDQLVGTLWFGRRGGQGFTADETSLMQTVCNQVAVAVERTRLVDALQERARALEEANSAKSDFLATMSHELRTPLNAMVGYTDLLLMGVPDPISPGAQAQVDRIRGAAVHLSQLIEEVLTYARIEAGQEELHLDEVEIQPLLAEVTALMEPLARQKGLAFTLRTDRRLARVRTDARKVRQILLNLLGNAVKFTDQGEVRVEVRQEDAHLVLEVSDTGIGIASAHQDRIFEPFWQVDGTKTRRAGGTGLGLGVVRQLAQRLGGDVEVRSQHGEGSTFTVRLPM